MISASPTLEMGCFSQSYHVLLARIAKNSHSIVLRYWFGGVASVPFVALGQFSNCKVVKGALYHANNIFLGNITQASQLPNGTLDITKLTARNKVRDIEGKESKPVLVVAKTTALAPSSTTNTLHFGATTPAIARDLNPSENQDFVERVPLEEIALTFECSTDGPTPCVNQWGVLLCYPFDDGTLRDFLDANTVSGWMCNTTILQNCSISLPTIEGYAPWFLPTYANSTTDPNVNAPACANQTRLNTLSTLATQDLH
jgi:hypothetical protein